MVGRRPCPRPMQCKVSTQALNLLEASRWAATWPWTSELGIELRREIKHQIAGTYITGDPTAVPLLAGLYCTAKGDDSR